MTLEENTHYVATVTVKKITKTVATEPKTSYQREPAKHEAARTENTVVNLALSDDDLNTVLGLVMEHLRLHLKRS